MDPNTVINSFISPLGGALAGALAAYSLATRKATVEKTESNASHLLFIQFTIGIEYSQLESIWENYLKELKDDPERQNKLPQILFPIEAQKIEIKDISFLSKKRKNSTAPTDTK